MSDIHNVMNHIVVFEDEGFRNLLPLVYWRCCWDLRAGYCSLLERLLTGLGSADVSFYCREILKEVCAERLGRPVNKPQHGDRVTFINGRLLWSASTKIAATPGPFTSVVQWQDDQVVIVQADEQLASRLMPEVLLDTQATKQALADVSMHVFLESPRLVRYSWDLVHANAALLKADWKASGEPADLEGRIYEGVHLLNRPGIHIGRGTTIKPGVVLDAEDGPIFIGERVTICPNVSIEGPCYIGDDSLVQPGAVLRDGMSIGRRCKVGGELESSIIHGFSNKQHDGF